MLPDGRPLAALLDSGGVLIQPAGGRWNPRADFEPTVLAHDPGVPADRFAAAIAAGDRFLDACATTPDRDDYHRAVLSALGIAATPALLADLRRPIAPSEVLETFPEVAGTLAELRRRGVRMAVVSDAWPDLPAIHDALGIGGFFEAYAISAVLGCCKPDPRMYRHASEALGLPPARCVFVDDDPDLVAAAIGLGYQGRALCRSPGRPERLDVPAISSLDELLPLFPVREG